MTQSKRIAPVSMEEFAELARVIYAGRPLPEDMRSMSASNVELILGNHPEVAKAYFNFGLQLLLSSKMSERARELIVLRVAWLSQAAYSWAHHVDHMQKKGFTPQDFAAIKAGPESPHWPADERDLLRAADQLFETRRIDDRTWASLASRLGPQELMEIVFVVGNYVLLAMAEASFGIELEPGYEGAAFSLT